MQHDQAGRMDAARVAGAVGPADPGSERAFWRALELAAEEAQVDDECLSVIVVEADDIGAIRAKHGAQLAESALQQLHKILRVALGASAALARFEGDQFGVLLWAAGIQRATDEAAALQTAISLQSRTFPFNFTVSMGVATGATRGQWSGEQLLLLAGRRRDQARRMGRGLVVAGGHPGLANNEWHRWPALGSTSDDRDEDQLTLL